MPNRDISFHPSRYDVSLLIIYAVEIATCLLLSFYRFINIYVEFLKISDKILQREITANETVSHFVWCWITPLVFSGELEILHRVKMTPVRMSKNFWHSSCGNGKSIGLHGKHMDVLAASVIILCIFYLKVTYYIFFSLSNNGWLEINCLLCLL